MTSHSVSRSDPPLQPTTAPEPGERHGEAALAPPPAEPTAHVVLYQPEIPQNTGNIGRTCVATGAKLWIVRPAGFQLDDRRVRRAGLDYWQHLQLGDAADWNQLTESLAGRRFFFFSRFAQRTLWEVELQTGDVFVFGSETSGLPAGLLEDAEACALRLPTRPEVRSLNLATTVGIVLYEQQRQRMQRGGETPG